MITLYETPNCPRCKQIAAWLDKHVPAYAIADLIRPHVLAELRTEGIFSMEAPIVRNGDAFYLASDLFPGDVLDEGKLAEIIGEKPCN